MNYQPCAKMLGTLHGIQSRLEALRKLFRIVSDHVAENISIIAEEVALQVKMSKICI